MKARSLSNGDVSRGAGIPDPQTVFALVKRKSKKSDHAARLATYFDVPLDRLLADDFDVSEADIGANKQQVKEPNLTPEALDVARAWLQLSPGRQQAVRESIFLEAVVAKQYPWLLTGRPPGQSYNDYERAVLSDIVRITKRMLIEEEGGEK